MLPRVIEYEDFNGNMQKRIFHFHLSKPELIELEVSEEDGFGVFLERIVKAENKAALVQWFKKIVLMAYGVKSEDGEYFDKTDEIRNKFAASAAYIALYEELAEDEGKAVEFLQGIFPKSMMVKEDQDKPVSIPRAYAPSPPTPPNPQG